MRVDRIVIPHSHLSLLIDEAKRVLPAEACALLIGTYEDSTASIKETVVTSNTESSPIAFTVDAHDLLNAYVKAEENKMEVIGIFHSHPASPKPSHLDVKFMKLNPVVWLIMSNISWKYRAYQWHDDLVTDVEVVEA